MCIEVDKDIEPFDEGFKVMVKEGNGYLPRYDFCNKPVREEDSPSETILRLKKLRDKFKPVFLNTKTNEEAYRDSPPHTSRDHHGWHIFKSYAVADYWKKNFRSDFHDDSNVIVKVKGHNPIIFGMCGDGITGVFKNITILEEIK